MTLTKDRIVEIMKDRSQISSPEAKVLVETIIETIKVKLETSQEVKISGFGKWIVREKKSRPGRNPHTGEKIEITARKVVTFHPAEKLRRLVNEADLKDHQLTIVGEEGDEDGEQAV